MRAYFDVSDESVGNHTWNALNDKGIPENKDITREDVYFSMETLRHAIEAAEGGELYDNEIFYFESVLYLSVLYDLIASTGHTVWLLYDCFYIKGFCPEMVGASFETLVQDLIKNNFRTWSDRLLLNRTFFNHKEPQYGTGKGVMAVAEELNKKYGKFIYRGDEWLNKNK